MSPRQQLAHEELIAHLDEQIAFLEISAVSYDKGFYGEAVRMAAIMRTLVHDGGSNKSLLGQLGMKSGAFFDTAAEHNPSSPLPYEGLIAIAFSPPNNSRFVAMLDDIPGSIKEVSFDEWWNGIAFVDNQRRRLSRSQLVLIAAQQDGGVHIDTALDKRYASLKKNLHGWSVNEGSGDRPLDGPQCAALRQITHELLKTLKPGYSKMPNHNALFFLFGGIRAK